MLETIHSQEYYLQKAEEYPLLADVLSEDCTLTIWLDSVVEDLREKPSEETCAYLEVICALCAPQDGIPAPDEMPRETANKFLARFLGLGGGAMSANYLAAALLYVIPPWGPLAAAVLVLWAPFAGLITPIVGTGIAWEGLKEKRRELLQPLYEEASKLDADISRCFMLDHFHGVRPRFERTYLSLTEDERTAIDTELYQRLQVGGIEMGEPELETYLAGLLEPEE